VSNVRVWRGREREPERERGRASVQASTCRRVRDARACERERGGGHRQRMQAVAGVCLTHDAVAARWLAIGEYV